MLNYLSCLSCFSHISYIYLGLKGLWPKDWSACTTASIYSCTLSECFQVVCSDSFPTNTLYHHLVSFHTLYCFIVRLILLSFIDTLYWWFLCLVFPDFGYKHDAHHAVNSLYSLFEWGLESIDDIETNNNLISRRISWTAHSNSVTF